MGDVIMPPKHTKSELTVITKAREVCTYILTVTAKSPARFRFTLTSRLQNYALDILEALYYANDVYVREGDASAAELRVSYQRRAMTRLGLLDYIAQLAMEEGCILYKQYTVITRSTEDCRNLLGAWIKSDKRRFSIRGGEEN